MKSIERRFKSITEKNPYWSSYYCFYEAIKGQNFSEQRIRRWFQKLVSKDDYVREEKRDILNHLIGLSKTMLNRTEIEGKSAQGTTK